MKERREFIIVGAGPSGLLLGYLLKKMGKDVLILERSPSIKRKVCGEYLCPRGVELLNQLGLKEELSKKFLEILGMKIVSPSGKEFETYFPSTNSFNCKGMALNRQVFDSLLLNLYQENLGGEIQFGVTVKNVEQLGQGYLLGTDVANYQCTYLVGADGRKSTLTKLFDLDVTPQSTLVSLHCYLPFGDNGKRLGEMHLLGDGQYVGIDPINHNEINFSVCLKASDIVAYGGPREAIEQLINKSEDLKKRFANLPTDLKIHSTTPITHKVKRYHLKNFILIGDAANFIDPLTGEGIYNALWCARALAQEIENSKDITRSFWNFKKKYKRNFFGKILLNWTFQWIIQRRFVIEWLAAFIEKKEKRGHILVGIIGNVFSPFEGLRKIL